MEHYTFRQPINRVRVYDLDEGYDVPKYKWLRKLLKRLGLLKHSVYYQHYDAYETFTISAPRMRGLIQQFLRETQRTTFRSPSKIYVGLEGYRQLMDDFHADKVSEAFSWPVKVYGMEIVFTPFLVGTMFLPVFD